MPKRPRGNEWGGGGAHQRFGRRSRGSGDAEADHGDKVAGTEIHDEVETVLHRLPDGVVRHALSFLAGNDVGNFCYTCKLARPYFHCVSELTLANATALPSLVRRLSKEGILGLRSLHFDHQAVERFDVKLPTPGDVVTALLRNADKVPCLEEVDLGDVALHCHELEGICRVTNLRTFVLPAVYPRPLVEAPVHPDDDELMRPMHRRDLATLGNEIKSLPRLKSLTMGRMSWPTWDFTALCGSMEAREEVIREPDASERRILKAGAWSNGTITEVNLSLVLNLSDEQLKSFLSCVPERYHMLESLNLSFADPLEEGNDVHPRLTTLSPLAEVWKKGALSHLRDLDLSYQFNLGNRALKMLAQAWLAVGKEGCASLRCLRMRDSGIGQDPDRAEEEDEEEIGCWGGLMALSQAVAEGLLDNLVELDLQDNFLSEKGMGLLATALAREGSMPNLEVLDLSIGREEFSRRERKRGAMGYNGIKELSTALLRGGKNLKRVGLGGHLLGGLGSDLLCKAMDDGALPSIEQLDLSVNSIGELAALNLAQWLAKGTRPSLQRLLLGDNKISGLLFLEAGIPEEPPKHKLVELQLDHNLLGDCPLEPLLRRFCSPTIVRLNLSKNPDLGTQAAATTSLGRSLSHFPNLHCLDLSRCGKHKYLDIKALTRAIDRPLPLRVLSLARSHMGIKSLEVVDHHPFVDLGLLQASNRFPVLTELEIDGMSTNCSRMLRSLYNALKKGKLPHLLSLTFTCRAVGDNEAWKQHALANEIERLRPWLRAFISWPTKEEDQEDGASDADDDDGHDGDEDDHGHQDSDDSGSDSGSEDDYGQWSDVEGLSEASDDDFDEDNSLLDLLSELDSDTEEEEGMGDLDGEEAHEVYEVIEIEEEDIVDEEEGEDSDEEGE